MFAKIPWYSIGRFTLIVLCLILVLALVVMVLPIYLDITAFKGPVEELLSDLVKAPVTVEEIRLHPSPWPTIRIAGVEVASWRRTDSPPFSRIDRAEIQVSLPALLRKQLRLERVVISDAAFHVHRPEGQSGNWPVWSESSFQIKELAGIELDNVTVTLEDHQTIRATLVVDHLTCDVAENRPLDLDLSGSLQGLPLSVEASGPTLAAPLVQASDFPLSIRLSLAALQLDIEGTASREPRGTRFQLAFNLASEELGWVPELAGIDVPPIGGLELSGELSNRETRLEISKIAGSMGTTTVHGRLAWDFPDSGSELSGRLSLGQLDLEPWRSSAKDAETDNSAPLPFSLLSSTNAHLQLSLEGLTGMAVAVEDVELELELIDGSMSIPATLRAAGIPLSVQLDLQAETEEAQISSRISTRDLSLTQLEPVFEIPDALDGEIGALDLAITTSGSSRNDLRANSVIEVSASEARVRIPDETGERPIEILIDQARAEHRPGSPVTSTAHGSLLDESFTVDLETAGLDELIGQDYWPVSLGVQAAGATLELTGNLERVSTGLDFDVEFDLYGDRLSDLENWFGFSPRASIAYDLTGRVTSASGARLLRFDDSSVGRTQFAGRFAWNPESPEPSTIDLHAAALDIRELRDLSDPVADLDTERNVLGIDMPILPSKKRLRDAEIDLTVDRLLRDTLDLTEIRASFHIRQGRLDRSPFSFAHGTREFQGEIALDLRGETPDFTLELHGDGKNLGDLLEQEGLLQGFDVGAERLDLRIDAAGATVREIVETADLSGQLIGVRWQFQPGSLNTPLEIRLDQVDLIGPEGEPIVLTGKGFLEQEPLDFRVAMRFSENPIESRADEVPFQLEIGLAATKIDLSGNAHLPIRQGEFEMQVQITGETLATLSAPLDTDMPDIGPYRVTGDLTVGDGGFSVTNFDSTVGESDLHGEVRYSRVEDRPSFQAKLTSEKLKTVDFLDLDKAATPEGGEVESPATDGSAARPHLTLEAFNSFDASIELAAHQIVAVGGQTDDLMVNAELRRGKLDLEIRRAQQSDQEAELVARVRPWGQGIEAEIRADWDRQPYGVMADLLNPKAAGGSWGVDLDLSSRGADLAELKANLGGHVYFVDYPVNINATIFDLWGGGLLGSLLPIFQLGEESRVNCTVAKFQVDQGLLTTESLIVDATRTRIRGKGTVDLPSDRIRLQLKPRPKQRSLINLSTPVKIRGPLAKPNVQVSTGGLAVTFFRISLWAYTVWRDILRAPLPADGRDVCIDPFTAVQKP